MRESAAAIVKIFSGALSDWLGKRKLIVASGYGLAVPRAMRSWPIWRPKTSAARLGA